MNKKTPMTEDAARRIQSATDKKDGGGDGFKERAQRTAAENAKQGGTANTGGKGGGSTK